MQITGNTVFIPGATSGIGLGLALRLQAAGNTVIVGGRRTELLASIAAARDAVLAAHPDLNVLIAMAGIMLPENLRDATFVETAERTVVTNLLGPIRLIAAFEAHLEAQPAAAILTVSSGLAYVPLPATPTYSATKAAIHSFTESLRVQLADTAVQVIEIVPPAVQTTLMGQQDSPHALPLEAYLDETMALLAAQPEAEQILVEGVKFLRDAPLDGTYPQVLAALSARSR